MPDETRCAGCLRARSEICLLCVEGSMFRRRPRHDRLETKSANKGAEFEREVRDRYNEARLQKNSGAAWHRPGDVLIPGALGEAKDRGYVTGRGRKAFTVHKDDLEKVSGEADGLLPLLVFRFRDDDELYAVVRYEDLCDILIRLASSDGG